jgi:hypothetical protein
MADTKAPARALSALAHQQHGIFTRAQATSLGLTAGQINWRVRAGVWVVVDYGVYRASSTPSSWHQRLLAACLAGPAVASHRSAGRLWHLPGCDDSMIEVTAVRHLRRHARDVTWHESRHLDGRDVTIREGVPVTSVDRTIIDLAAVVPESQLLAALDDACRRNLTSCHRVAGRARELHSRRRGQGRLRRVLEHRLDGDPVPESVLETEFDALVRSLGLPEPVRQHEVRLLGGRRARIDFAYPSEQVAVEIDGARHHACVGDWHDTLLRQNELAALGWIVLRFTVRDLRDRSEEVAATVRRALTAQRTRGVSECNIPVSDTHHEKRARARTSVPNAVRIAR